MWNDLLQAPVLRYRIMCKVTGPLLYIPPLYETDEEKKPLSRGRVFYAMIRDYLYKQFTCVSKKTCIDCKIEQCDWRSLFDPSKQEYHFVILPPLSRKKVYRQGECFYFELKLLGRAAKHELFTKRFMPAIEMGGRLTGIGNWIDMPKAHFGRFDIEKIFLAKDKQWLEIYNRQKWFFPRSASHSDHGIYTRNK